NNLIIGNYIGTDVSGTAALGNAERGIGINNAGQGLATTQNIIERNLISGNGTNGIDVWGAVTEYNTVSGNFIGTDASGTVDLGNGSAGVWVGGGAQNNTIGGTTLQDRNILSGNDLAGIVLSDADTNFNTVVGNFIGTDVDGTTALGNRFGVVIYNGPQSNTIGGITEGKRNIISSNDEFGIGLFSSGTDNNTVIGNYIGTDVSGAVVLGNGGTGVLIEDGPQNNAIGGNGPQERNVISGNVGNGFKIKGAGTNNNTVSGNFIGTDVNGTADLGNSRLGVVIAEGAQSNTIGGTTVGERNLISGNDDTGIAVSDAGTNNTIIGNFIGTDASGTTDLGNFYDGIYIGHGANLNTIEGNVISGNDANGIAIDGDGTDGNIVRGNLIGTNFNGTAKLENASRGVDIRNGAAGNTVGGMAPDERNIISGNALSGVRISGAGSDGNTVSGNYIGTDATGTLALPNSNNGVSISDGSSYNLIGGSNATPGTACSGECNLISGNGDPWGYGVSIAGGGTDNNTVSGNYIGTDASGTVAVPNSIGVGISFDASYNVIGGNEPGQGNVISGNRSGGVYIPIAGSFNEIVGNTIGVDGSVTVGNAGSGIVVAGGSPDTEIQSNTIKGNAYGGIVLIDDPTFPTPPPPIERARVINNTVASNESIGIRLWTSGALVQENAVYGHQDQGIVVYSGHSQNKLTLNSIYDNAGLGIDLRDDANDGIKPPVIVYADTTTGVANGTACAGCTIEVFSDDDDEGRWYEGTTTANGAGDWSFSKGSAFTGANVHATATDADGNTSEFSGSPPVVSSVSPNSTVPGTVSLVVTINGDYFRDDEPLTVDLGAGVIATSTQFISSIQLEVVLDVDAGASLGPRDVTVTNFDGQGGTLPGGFTVTAASPFPPPVVNSIIPTMSLQGKRVDLTVNGQNFVDRPRITFSGGNVTINSVTVVSATELSVDMAVSDTAPAYLHDVTVTNPDGQSDTLAEAFEVQVRLFTDVSYWAGISTQGQRGVAWGDYDNDGHADLFVSNHNALYHNNGDGTFTDNTYAAGRLWWGGEGVAWGDYDNDGDLDLYTSDWGSGDTLYRNEGDGTFTNVTDQAGLQDPGHGQSVAWGDYDGDGNLDLYVTNNEGDPNYLFRNEGDGTFSDVTAQAQVADTGDSRGVAWGDYDNDGNPDLYVTNSGVNRLFQNQGNGTFVDRAAELGVTAEAYGGGSGVAWGDYDNDGDLDLALSAGGTAVLFRNDGGAFADTTTSAGVGSAGIGGESVAWADYDNDGWLDLYVTNGEGAALYHNQGDGTFEDVTGEAGVGNDRNFGSAWGDYDNDGDLDLFAVRGGLPELGEPDLQDTLYRNNSEGNHWLHVKTVGTISNRAGIGARVRVIGDGLSQIREVSGGSGRTSQDSLPVEFGFGMYDGTVTVEVTWPSGVVDTLTDVAVDQVITVIESGGGAATISEVKVTNVRDTSFTVSWLTDIPSDGHVNYGADPANTSTGLSTSLDQIAYDDRGGATRDDTHYVTIKGLSPNTTYYFDVVSGGTADDNDGAHYTVTTGPTLGLPSSDTIFGQVFKEDETTPAEGAIVYITLFDDDGSGSPDEAAPLSALVDDTGYWYTNLGNARTSDLSAYFVYSASGDKLRLEAQGAADGTGSKPTVDTGNDTPAPTIYLSHTVIREIPLQIGWNHISLPLEPLTSYTAEGVCDEIISQGGDVTEIDRWYASG
ncbi:MAG: VCBS repeat-containing protein, partial [Chloroflexi bacterium]|nr:VCBS repeat-containing protein [Chloroflexota bacterium]